MKNLKIYTVLVFLLSGTLIAQTNILSNKNPNQKETFFTNPNELIKNINSKDKALKQNLMKLSDRKETVIDEFTFESVFYDSNFIPFTKTHKYDYTYSPIGTSTSLIIEKQEGNDWIPLNKEINNYNYKGNLIEKIYQSRVDNKWENTTKINYRYYEEDTVYVEEYSSYYNHIWRATSRDSIIVNSEGDEVYNLYLYNFNGWEPQYERRITYEFNPKIITYFERHSNNYNGIYTDTLIYIYKYNSRDDIEEIRKIESRGYGRIDSYEYDENGNLISRLSMDQSNYVWENSSLLEYEYDEYNNVIAESYKSWIDNAWHNNSKTEYRYNFMNRKDTTYIYQWEEEDWQYYNRHTNEYYPSGLLKEDVLANRRHNGIRYYWQEFRKYAYSYDGQGNIIYRADQTYQYPPTYWVSLSEEHYEYNANGKETYYLEKRRADNVLGDYKRRFTKYNDDGYLLEGYAEIYENGGWKFDFYYPEITQFNIPIYYSMTKISITYGTRNQIDYESPEKTELFQNYPNPFNPTTKIFFTLPNKQDVKIEVFNSIGQKVATLMHGIMEKGIHSVDFNRGKLASGIYFYTIQTDRFFEAKKMVLIK